MSNTPQIRFAGFTDAWEQRKLSDIMTEGLSNGIMNNPGTNEFGTLHINVINMYTPDKIHIEDLESSACSSFDIQKCNVEVGDIFMTRSSLKPEGIAEANVLLEKGSFVYDDHLIRMKVTAAYDPIFVKILLSTPLLKNQFIMKAKTTAFTTIGQNDIATSYGLFPPKEEQIKIGQFFIQLDNLITLHQRKCDALQKFKKSMLQKMFPQNGESVPEIRFAGFTDAWEQRKLGECFDERTERSADGELIAVTINSGVVKASELNRHDNSSEDKSNYKVVRVNDIAYNSMRMWQGASGYSQYDGILSPAYTVVIPRENVNPVFFSYMFKRTDMIHEFQINSQGLTSDTWNLKFPAFSTISANVPKSEEQQAIGNYFTNLDNLITLHQRKLETLQKMKKSLLQKMFP